jgi:hypothetical protein
MTERDDQDDSPIPGLSALRDVTPPPSLVPGVMRRIAEPAPPSLWRWLRRPRRVQLAISPLGLGGLALAAGVALFVAFGGPRRHESAMVLVVPPSAPGDDGHTTVVVRFTLRTEGAHQVAVAGDFNDWDPVRTPLVREGGDTFAATVRLPHGAHEYMFVVDGKWVTDPQAAERRPDGFGRDNAVLRL